VAGREARTEADAGEDSSGGARGNKPEFYQSCYCVIIAGDDKTPGKIAREAREEEEEEEKFFNHYKNDLERYTHTLSEFFNHYKNDLER